MNDQTFLILFRLLHIGFGIIWAGSVFYMVLFVIPTVKRSGSEGTTFWLQLGKSGYAVFIRVSAIISIVSGFMLLWKLSNHFERIWFTTLYAKIMIAGIVTSIIAFLIDSTINGPATARINKISANHSATHEHLQELNTLQKRVFSATILIAVLLGVAIISMSIFRWVS